MAVKRYYYFIIARMKEGRSAFKILIGKPTGKRPSGRPWWEDNIRMDPKEIGINTRDWVALVHDKDWRALVNAALNIQS